jgi:hypothetical protein
MEDEKADGLEQYDTKHIKDGRMLPQSHSAWGETGLGEQHRKGTQSAVIRGGAVVKTKVRSKTKSHLYGFLTRLRSAIDPCHWFCITAFRTYGRPEWRIFC